MDNIAISGPIGYRTFLLEKVCQANEGHEHNYDHTTLVIRGAIEVHYSFMKDGQKIEGTSRRFEQGQYVEIKANVRHTIKALEPNTVYHCIFSHRDFDGLITQTYVGNPLAFQ